MPSTTSTTRQQQQDPVVFGWLLLALREAMGDPVVRNAILEHDLGRPRGVEFGQTFEYGFTLKQLEKYLQTIVAKTGLHYLLFTAQNLPDKRSRETHYQTYIVDYRRKNVWVIDPARTPTGKGIYFPYISENVVIPFFEEHGWTTAFSPTSSACQKGTRDVFCQSWSLYLQIEFMRMLLSNGSVQTLQIPGRKEDRYQLLLAFFQKAFALQSVCDQVVVSYTHLIKTHPDLVREASTAQERKSIRDSYLRLDPCRQLQNMTVQDLE